MSKTIAIFTTSRAEFGILLPFIKKLEESNVWEYKVFVGGAHLTLESGNTIKEIFDSNVKITETFDFLLNSDKPQSLTKSLGIEIIELANIFANFKFDYVCILGDRYELLPIVAAAILFKKPIIHISGGEVTEGVIDEQVRHMITKAAHIHFTYTDEYVSNILRMGEEKWRVYNTGALGVDNLIANPIVPKEKLFSDLNLDINSPTILLTYHPLSLNTTQKPLEQIEAILSALEELNFQIVITAPNVEIGREEIYNHIKFRVSENSKLKFFESLGQFRYNNIIRYCEFVVGNSSSGIVYVPFYKVPTINIGSRQKGRIQHESIINTSCNSEDIRGAINLVLSAEFKERIRKMNYKFGDGTSAQKMVDTLQIISDREDLLIKKLVFKENE